MHCLDPGGLYYPQHSLFMLVIFAKVTILFTIVRISKIQTQMKLFGYYIILLRLFFILCWHTFSFHDIPSLSFLFFFNTLSPFYSSFDVLFAFPSSFFLIGCNLSYKACSSLLLSMSYVLCNFWNSSTAFTLLLHLSGWTSRTHLRYAFLMQASETCDLISSSLNTTYKLLSQVLFWLTMLRWPIVILAI